MSNLIFLISEAQRNFCNELFDSVEAQRNSAIAERHFWTELKRNLSSAIEISQHNERKYRIFCNFIQKKSKRFAKKSTFINIMIEMEQNFVQSIEFVINQTK